MCVRDEMCTILKSEMKIKQNENEINESTTMMRECVYKEQ